MVFNGDKKHEITTSASPPPCLLGNIKWLNWFNDSTDGYWAIKLFINNLH